MPVSEARRAATSRATARAKAVLKPGDRLYCGGCGGTRFTVTMTGWDGEHWITSKTKNDIHASHIIKVNGVPTSFWDDGEPYDDRMEREHQEWLAAREKVKDEPSR